jgi:hypothetical protein
LTFIQPSYAINYICKGISIPKMMEWLNLPRTRIAILRESPQHESGLALNPALLAMPEFFAQLALENFSGPAFGQRLGEEFEAAREFEFRQPLRRECEQIRFGAG